MDERPRSTMPGYYGFTRREIRPLLPDHAARVLEIGCGQGGTLAWLKESGVAARTTGIEIDPAAAALARRCVDEVIEGDADEAIARVPVGSIDLVLCLDVLEHLVDPWGAVARLAQTLRPGGSLVLSVPNIRHHSVTLPLLWSGRWRYAEAGILDRTHLRFFTREGATQLLTAAGLEPCGHLDTGLEVTRKRELWKPLLACTPWRDLGVFQFVMRGRKPLRAIAPALAHPSPALRPA